MASFSLQSSLCTSFPFPLTNKTNNSDSNAAARWRQRRFKVSCSEREQKEASAAVDRRSMLLSLGGLYGAAATLQARADPIKTDFKSCGAAFDARTKVPVAFECCPPGSKEATDPSKIIDFRDLPPPPGGRLRKAAHKMTEAEIDKYKMALQKMRNLDKTDPNDPQGFTQQANIHCAYCNGAHNQLGYKDKEGNELDLTVHYSWLFFPFHRWYLYFFERILGKLMGDDTLALPYWNWDNPIGMEMPPMFLFNDSSLYDNLRNNPDPKNPNSVINLSLQSKDTDPTKIISNNLSGIYNELIGGVTCAEDFLGKRYKAGDEAPKNADGGTLERGSHTGVHAWVGKDLGNLSTAGRDPAFYSHHANVDRLWALWESIPEDYSKKINKRDYLDASFLFYDEEKRLVRVKVEDCLDHTKLGYEFEESTTPWLCSGPAKKAVPVNIETISRNTQIATKQCTLDNVKRISVKKTKPGKADEVLVLENIVVANAGKLVKFDVFINDEDDEPDEISRPEYLGTFTQLPMKSHSGSMERSCSQRFNLKKIYERINIKESDDKIVVTIVPRCSDMKDVTIGGFKIIAA